jgi:RNA recognition motif-containing protein
VAAKSGFYAFAIHMVVRAGPVKCQQQNNALDEGVQAMLKMIYVGNLPFTATDADVRGLFSKHGTVHTVKLVMDRDTGRPRGFCFVEMENSAAHAAISALNGIDFGGRSLRVNEARDRDSGAQRRARY